MAEEKKSGFAAFIGRPNVGKSTLMNCLIGQKIAITSSKPQTTRNRIRTVYTDERGQIVFVDTPGMQKARNKLGEYMESAAERTITDVDVVLYMVEPSAYIGAADRHILDELKGLKVPVFLVINKTDTIRKEEVLPVIDAFRKEMDFAEILPVSAKTGQGTKELISVLFQYLPEGPAFFDEDTLTDQPVRAIVAELVREKALRLLQDEVPHGIAVSVDQMKKRDGRNFYDIDASIICEKDSHKGIIIGKGGSMLRQIGTQAREEIEKLLGAKVNLKLWVKVKKDWRDSDFLVKNYGYDEKEL